MQILQLDNTNENNGREVRVMQMDRELLNGGGDKDVQVSEGLK